MTPRSGFGALALALWAASLAMPAYLGDRHTFRGVDVLLIGWMDLSSRWLPPGSPLGWLANIATPTLSASSLCGRRVGPAPAAATVGLAALGLGDHPIGYDDYPEPARAGPGQLIWFASAVAVACSPVWEWWRASRRLPTG